MYVFDENWRERIGKKRDFNLVDWRFDLHTEFVKFAEEAADLASRYDWNFWGGGVDNYAITLSQSKRDGKYISIKLISGDNYCYYVSFYNNLNPNNIPYDSYKERIGENMNEALRYLLKYIIEHDYDAQSKPMLVMGGAYDRYPLAKLWAFEELEENKKEKEYVNA